MFLQRLYIKLFNNTYKYTSRLSKRTRDGVVFLCIAIFIAICFFGKFNLESNSTRTMIYGTISIIVMTVFSVKGEAQSIEWSRLIYYALFFFGTGIILVNLHHPVGAGYLIYALDLTIFYPALYFVWANRRDYDSLYSIVSLTILILGLTTFLYCFFLAATGNLGMDGFRVKGHKTSPNYLGMIGAVMVIAGLYLIFKEQHKRIIFALSSIGIGAGLSLIINAVSRTSMLTASASILEYFIFSIKKGKAEKRGTHLILLVLIAISVMVIGIKMDNLNQKMNSRNERATVDTTREKTIEKTEIENVSERILPTEKKHDYSSGRLKIWSIYLENISLFGQPFEKIEGELKATAVETRAHNNFLEYLFRCGILVGVLYVIYFIATCLKALSFLMKRERIEPEYVFVVMITSAYAINAMLEIATLPFTRVIPYIYFLSAAPLLCKQKK